MSDERLKIVVNVPNAISFARLLAVPCMVFCAVTGKERLFAWIILGSLVSDILDGLVARAFHCESRFGAILDGMADMGMYLSAVTGLFTFHLDFIIEKKIAIGLILLFYSIEKMKTFYHHRKFFNAFHTYCSKATAYLQGAFVVTLFFRGFVSWLFYPAMIVGILANIEEMLLTSFVKEYAHDVKGLYWVLKKRNT